MQQLDGYSDAAFAKALALTIFSLDDQETYLEERNEGLKQGAKNGMELTPDVQAYLIEKIRNVETRMGYYLQLSMYHACLMRKKHW